jgi:hypothetical protein
MARVFAITTTATTLRLDAQGRAETSFTVSNASGRALRGRAEVRATDSNQQGWLSIDGDSEREFPANGTHQIAARIAAPPGSPAGKFSFRLDMVSAQNPDEDFAEGPTVTFEVPAPAPKKPFPWWIVAVAAAVVLIVGGLTAYLMMREPAPAKQAAPPAAAPPAAPPSTVPPPAARSEKLSLTGQGGAVPDGNAGGATFDIVVNDSRAVAASGNNVTVTLVGVNHGALVDLTARLEHVGYGPPVFIFDRVLNKATYICALPFRGTYTFSSAGPRTLQSQCGTGGVGSQGSLIPEGAYLTTQPDDATNSNLSSVWNGRPVAGLWRLSMSDTNVNTGPNQFVMNTNWTWRLEITVSN